MLYDLPADRLAELEGSLVGRMDADEIARALRVSTACFFDASKRAEQRLGGSRVGTLKADLYHYLHAIGLPMGHE